MLFRALISICFCLAITVSAAKADLADLQPSYTRIAAKCGPNSPSFSASDYAGAMQDAAKAMKDAKKQGSRARQDAIAKSVEQMKECQKQEDIKFVIPPMTDCRKFLNGYKAFSARAATLISQGKITEDDRTSIRERFRKPAEDCIRDIMSKCIDPNKTSDIDFVIEVFAAASDFGFINSYKTQTGVERFVTETNPGFLTMRFCTETDYACTGNPAACSNRIRQIKEIMQTYMRR